MKVISILGALLLSLNSFGYENLVTEKALKEFNNRCSTTLVYADIDSVEQVDDDWDYSAMLVNFVNGGQVYITVTRSHSQPQQYDLWLDEVFCN